MNPHGWQGPPQGFPQQQQQMVATQTVAKVPLYPGERVLYYLRPNQLSTRLQYFLFGTIFLVLLFGLYFLYLGIFFETAESQVWVITTQRIFTVNGAGKVMEQVGVHEIQRIVNETGRGRNSLIVHGPSTLVMFRRQEDHNIQHVGTILENIRNPAFLQQAPTAQYEP